MKQICTLIAALCLLVIGQKLYAQTVVVNSTAPVGVTFGTPITVSSTNGFMSTNTTVGTFNQFAKGRTDTILSPSFYYPSQESMLYFDYNLSSSKAMTVTPIVLIITSAGDTIFAAASAPVTFTGGGVGVDYYISVNLPAPINPTESFKIALAMPIAAGDKAVTAYTLASNALRGTPPAQGSLPLPVTFSGLYANKVIGGISLTWNVATETDLAGYEVQRSTDGANFSKIGFVVASNQSTYNFLDSKSFDVAYFRIKSIDIDGKFKYSTVVRINGQQTGIVMKAFPMPVQSQLTIQHNAASNNSKIELVSVDGRLLKSANVAKGVQQSSIDMSSAKAGVYVIRFVNDANIETLKVIKQ